MFRMAWTSQRTIVSDKIHTKNLSPTDVVDRVDAQTPLSGT